MERDSLSERNALLSAIEASPDEYHHMLSARLRALEEAISDLCWLTTDEGHFCAGQASWERFTGQNGMQAMGRGWLEAAHPGDRKLLEMRHAQCVRTKQPCDIVCLLRNAEGHYKYLSLRCIPVLNDAGRVHEVMYLGTLLLPGQQEAHRWRHRIGIEHLEALLIDIAHDAILVFSPTNGHILSWNQGASRLYGYSEEEAVGRLAPELLQTQYPVSQEAFVQALIHDSEWEGELKKVRRDGRLVTVETRFVVMHSEDGRPLAVLEVSRDVTERKRTEQQLKEYIQLAETAAQIGLWTWDLVQQKGGVLPFPERVIAAVFPEYKPGQLLNDEQFLQIVHPDDREITRKAIHDAWEQRSEYRNEFRVFDTEQSILWYAAYGRTVCNEQGEPVRMVGIVLNITERKRIEQALQDANEKVMALIESITDAFMALDKDWRCVYINSQASHYIGKSREEMLGKVFWEVASRERNTIFEQKLREAMDEQKTVLFDLFAELSGCWFVVRAYPAQGGITVFVSDITERKQMEEALRKSEAKLRRLVEANVSGVAVGDSQGRIIEANDAYLKLLGYSREELEHDTIDWRELTPPEYREADEHALQALRETGVCQPYEKEYFTKQGERVPILFTGATIEGGEQAERHIVFVVDLTRQRVLEKQREHLLHLVSHELRTPLTAINGSLQLARRRLLRAKQSVGEEAALSEEVLNKIEEILLQSLRQTHVLNRLIDDLVESARITAEKLSLTLESHNLVEIVRGTVEDMRFIMPGRSILLEDMPQEVQVLVDAGRINQVLANLIANALKYSPHEQPVAIGITLDKQVARVWVRDWGAGLSPEDQQYIWQRYFQGKGVQDRDIKSVNLGLGLYLCRLLIEQHQGQIGVESQLGQGSTFWFTVPLQLTTRESAVF
jgi:PAS domain S-box-containing protein